METTFQKSKGNLNFNNVKSAELQLEDVMEIIDVDYLKVKMKEVEEIFSTKPTEINKSRLGIVYHEAALNLSLLSKTPIKGYAQRVLICLVKF